MTPRTGSAVRRGVEGAPAGRPHLSMRKLVSICTLAMVIAAPVYSEQSSVSLPRGPIKTPLGSSSSDVLFSKITVSDVQKSYAFYTEVIGLKPAISTAQKEAPAPPGPDPKSWPAEIALNFSGSFADPFFDILPPRNGRPTREMTDMVVIGLKVPDAPAVIRRVKEAGYEVIREAPVVGPGEMSIGMVRDPDGYRLEILQAATYPARGP
jgi:predicted enzyme related to lactoylglutathione lyase